MIAAHNDAGDNSTGIIVMQTRKHPYWQDLGAHLLYLAAGLSALSLLVTWSLEQLAATLFSNG